MTRVTVDSDTSAKLSSFFVPVELCDDSGRTLGYFQPVLPPAESRRLLAECPFSEAELRRRQQVRTGRPLAEILEDLRTR
jgi:hypothetical protein